MPGALDAALSYMGEAVGVDVPIDARFFAGKVSATFLTRHGPLDVVIRPDGTDGYADLVRGAVSRDVGGREISVASIDDIIRSTRAAGRPKDQKALRPLLDWARRHR